MSLRTAYEQLLPLINWLPESYEVVRTAEHHRQFWKPDKVRVLLLAESHVYTADTENQITIAHPACEALNCPSSFVRLVYCLGYGANHVLDRPLVKNSGTPQYWDLFYKCSQLTNASKPFDIKTKLTILQQLKAQGIWLLDVSPLALYGMDANRVDIKKTLTSRQYEQLLRASWTHYAEPAVLACQPQLIIVIGKMVWNTLKDQLAPYRHDWCYQPNARKGKSYDYDHDPSLIASRINSLLPQPLKAL
jgi:hypothetical protein